MMPPTLDSSRTMQRIVACVCGLAVFVLGDAIVRAETLPLTKEEQVRVDRAIDEGVVYLKRSQGTHGTWAGPKQKHQVGYAALPGLTLLECGVPASAQVIRRVAAVVRRAAPNLDATYEIALCILFLDRLGDPKDKDVIQALAVRLMAGQAATGGWTYKCPRVGKNTQQEILAALRKLDPPVPLAGTPAQRKPAIPPLTGTITSKPPALKGTTTGSRPPANSPRARAPELLKPTESKPLPKPAIEDKAKPADAPPLRLPARLKALAVFKDQEDLPWGEGAGKATRSRSSVTDNSNTQFALLAVWVAQRHDVPARRSLRLLVRRFETSQNLEGSWGYRYLNSEGEPAMTCVGLLGLAVGHGIARPPQERAGKAVDRKPVVDARIVNGLTILSQSVGKPVGNWRNRPMENLYFLWSLERAAVLYGLPAIGDRDWYRWGAEILVANQGVRGAWTDGGYHGASPTIDTCLALLFLKRANFVADLGARLPFKPAELTQTIIQATPSSGSSGGSRKLEKKP